jgi:hypothetical protein
LIGKEELERMPSLRMKKWNATRWLGRYACLEALCGAYEYILDHLVIEMNDNTNKVTQAAAADLYRDLTSYENFLFFFFYRDIAESMAITSKKLQHQDLQIPDVARIIIDLRERLKINYPDGPNSLFFPEKVTHSARNGSNVLAELFKVESNLKDGNSRCKLFS